MEGKGRYLWWGVLGILLIGAAWKFFLPHGTNFSVEKNVSDREIVVYITGAVKKTGLLHLSPDARLNDALETAIALPEADLDALNPAQKLKDGEKINVPFKLIKEEGQGMESAETGTKNRQPRIDPSESEGKININTAGIIELDQLPGIGPALAERIIQYRDEQGLFNQPEDLKKVSGIGDKTFERMRSLITVGP